MRDRLALRPDLTECALEDRCLLYTPGLGPSAGTFLPVNSVTNQLVVPFASSSSSGGNNQNPGPNYFYLTIGVSGSSAIAGVGGPGSTISLYRFINLASNPNGSVAGGGGGGGGGGDGGASGSPTSSASFGSGPNFGGYSGTFSSGYNFGLGAPNNYGMTTTVLGSIPVHSFSGGGDIQEAPEVQAPADTPPPAPNPTSNLAPRSNLAPGVDTRGIGGTLGGKNLLGKDPAGSDALPNATSPARP